MELATGPETPRWSPLRHGAGSAVWPGYRPAAGWLPELCRLVEEISGLPNGYFKPIVGQGAFRYEQWGATAALTAGGARPYAFPFEPEVIGRSPQLVIGKWSDLGAVIQKLADYGMSAMPEQLDRSLLLSQRAGQLAVDPYRTKSF